jgi:hypothetical protein
VRFSTILCFFFVELISLEYYVSWCIAMWMCMYWDVYVLGCVAVEWPTLLKRGAIPLQQGERHVGSLETNFLEFCDAKRKKN